jgi:hypothetical protein
MEIAKRLDAEIFDDGMGWLNKNYKYMKSYPKFMKKKFGKHKELHDEYVGWDKQLIKENFSKKLYKKIFK